MPNGDKNLTIHRSLVSVTAYIHLESPDGDGAYALAP